MKRRNPHLAARFAAAYALVGLFALAAVLAFAGQLKAGGHHPHRYTQARHSQSCQKLRCVQVGDAATYTISGKVIAVSTPQPGVTCVQLAGPKQASQVCESS